jgi:hypothetical protein
LENRESAGKVADVINDIVAGRRKDFRIPVGLYAEGFLKFRASLTDEDWINSVSVSDEEWIRGMEQMGLQVRKYMQAEGLPKLNTQDAQTYKFNSQEVFGSVGRPAANSSCKQ